jgi:hypothetical protein
MQSLSRLVLAVTLGVLILGIGLALGGPFSAPVAANGGVILVDPAGNDQPACGQAPEPACRTIKYAVEVRAMSGDRIVAAGGVYTDTITVFTSSLKIYGAGSQTIIDGENQRGPMVTFGTGLTSTTILSGVTVQNGLAASTAGGLHLIDSSPSIVAVEIRANAGNPGGGLSASGPSAPEIHGSIICGNNPIDLYNSGNGTPNAAGNWWGTNSPQAGQAYSGTVSATPPISLNLAVHQTGSGVFPGGTVTLPPGSSGDVLVTMLGGGYAPPAGTEIVLTADQGLFSNGASIISVTLIGGTASTVVTPTVSSGLFDQQMTISAYHNCRPTQAVASQTVTIIGSGSKIFLPVAMKNYTSSACPLTSANQYDLIPALGPYADHPAAEHGDLNLSLRGYNALTGVPLTLVQYAGGADPNAPHLFGLFGDERLPTFSAAYQVNNWNWACGSHGCPGAPLANWPTTLIDMATTPGESIFLPNRAPTIFSSGGKQYKAMVLYAEENRITLNFTRDDTVANGYTVHLENFCVDPNLLSLYRAQIGNLGYRLTGNLPGLTGDQAIGTALDTTLGVAVRDRGQFMDPRSGKDWWPGKVTSTMISSGLYHVTGD